MTATPARASPSVPRAWTGRSLSAADLVETLSPEVAEELSSAQAALSVDPAAFRAAANFRLFPALAAEADRLRERLETGPGAVVIRDASFGALPPVVRTNAYWVLCAFIGEPLGQNDAGDLFVAVRDEGQRMTAGGRYHKSNDGGELHTDAPQFEEPPDWVALHCLHPAARGGSSRLVSAEAVHDALAREAPGLLQVLHGPFLTHRKPGPRTVEAPVFERRDGVLRARYLGEYVRSGHAVANRPLTPEQADALAALDALLADEAQFAVPLDLGTGDILLFDNFRLFHGRTAFEDAPGVPPRELSRVWLRARGAR